MKTEIVDSEKVLFAVDLLKRGELVAIPTETVYGLAASIWNEEALENIFKVKGRPSDNPLIVHVSSLEQVNDLVVEIPPLAVALMKKFWPGPLTLVLPKSKKISNRVSGGLSSVAIRMPSHQLARELIEMAGPLAAPSANLSGKPSPTSAFDVLEDLEGKIPLILDGGECEVGIESTVLSLLEKTPRILRPGKITREDLEKVLGKPVQVGGKDLNHSPGTRYKHYSPKAKVSLIYEEAKDGDLSPKIETIYSEFRKADREGRTEIRVHCSENTRKNVALMDRLIRASSK